MDRAFIQTQLETMVSNQRRFIAALGPSKELDSIALRYGPQWVELICDAIKLAGEKSVIFEMVPVQPFTQPVGMIYFTPKPGQACDPDTGLRSEAVSSEQRKMKANLPLGGSFLDDFVGKIYSQKQPRSELEEAFEIAWGEIEREIVGTMLFPSEETPHVKISWKTVAADFGRLIERDDQPYYDGIVIAHSTLGKIRPQLTIHDQPLLSNPDNRVVKVGFADVPCLGRPFRISLFVDNYFPGDQALAIRMKKTNTDRTLIWSPYLFSGSPFSGPPGCMFGLIFRGKITLIDTSCARHGIFV